MSKSVCICVCLWNFIAQHMIGTDWPEYYVWHQISRSIQNIRTKRVRLWANARSHGLRWCDLCGTNETESCVINEIYTKYIEYIGHRCCPWITIKVICLSEFELSLIQQLFLALSVESYCWFLCVCLVSFLFCRCSATPLN